MTEDKLPAPKGYKLLIAIPKLDETFNNSSIVRPDHILKKEETATVVGLVLKMGSLAFKDQEKFPDGAWCEEGDFVLMRAYSGTRFKVANEEAEQEFRLINDDLVAAVVPDPRVITRA